MAAEVHAPAKGRPPFRSPPRAGTRPRRPVRRAVPPRRAREPRALVATLGMGRRRVAWERGPRVVAPSAPRGRARPGVGPASRPARMPTRGPAGPIGPERLIRPRVAARARGTGQGPAPRRSATGATGVRRAVGAGPAVRTATGGCRVVGDPRVGAGQARAPELAAEAVKAKASCVVGPTGPELAPPGDGRPVSPRPHDAAAP